VRLQSYAQSNPLQVYQEEGFRLYNDMTNAISKDITTYAIRAQIRVNTEREEVVKNTRTNEGGETRRRRPKVKKNKYQRGMPRWGR
jgi:preprotein translocase subunit SecA